MFTNKARILVAIAFTLLMIFFIYKQTYQLAAVALLFVALLVWGYFKEGPIILAAKQFHLKDYHKAEELLMQIKNPEWLSRKRRGFYEFMMGGISLHKQEYTTAEQHYEQAAQYPLRSVNDHVAALVHIVNINIRQGNYEKAETYLQLAEEKGDKISAKMREVINKLESELAMRKN
ncbi:tetratricopeptide repeat protein [uncultured Mucilaginibacter sp.]|uniref:tetratricopeptide repeat protein n=1 Tax=uncultured Mucilaginibacter sp. TaxID=797541 RepID=UPI0025F8B0D7|nr:tetratricopeptide repeat protein [uncultured Mucilaginibacter sp.]